MVAALRQALAGRLNILIPWWMNTSASSFWGAENMSKMMFQALYRQFQTLRYGAPVVHFDCSGYQYGDAWRKMSRVMSIRTVMYQSAVARGCTIIMLPQSFGPFCDRAVAANAAGVLHLADTVYARDPVSYTHVIDLGIDPSNVRIAPDYSCLADAEAVANADEWHRRICIVPNVRMLDKTAPETAAIYLDTLRSCALLIAERGFEPCILLFDSEDRGLAKKLRRSLRAGITIYDPSPRKAKGILGACRGVISSRYHALVCAISQCTPALGTSWSHKYEALFDDYGISGRVTRLRGSGAELLEKLDLLTDDTAHSHYASELSGGARKQMARAQTVFDEIINACVPKPE